MGLALRYLVLAPLVATAALLILSGIVAAVQFMNADDVHIVWWRCGWIPFRYHDGVEFHTTKGIGSDPTTIRVFKTCRRCKATYDEIRMETPDEFESRQPKVKP